jgi:hypothetical protein
MLSQQRLNQTTRDWHTDIAAAPHRRLHSVQQVFESHAGQFRTFKAHFIAAPPWL